MAKVLKFMSGLLFGALVGAALVMLFAPSSGADTRQAIRDHIQAVLDEGRQAAEARRLEMMAQFETLKQV